MHCVSSVSYSVVRDITTVGPIVPSRGLRQGDPLSPYLFLLCAEGLSVLVRNREKSGFLHGARIVNGAPVVSHLFFADDCFLFFQANREEARIIKSILVIYWAASVQKVNFNKSSISFSGNTRADSIASVCNILEIKATTYHGIYISEFPLLLVVTNSRLLDLLKTEFGTDLRVGVEGFYLEPGKKLC